MLKVVLKISENDSFILQMRKLKSKEESYFSRSKTRILTCSPITFQQALFFHGGTRKEKRLMLGYEHREKNKLQRH